VIMSGGRYRRAGDKGCSDKTTRDHLHENLPGEPMPAATRQP
jgi:hypothetical protein